MKTLVLFFTALLTGCSAANLVVAPYADLELAAKHRAMLISGVWKRKEVAV
ncbi:hypothetical protein O7R01_26655 [Vibrio owensii]|nr:hypothetical protein [Vibrio owensii]MDA0385799.1 hypothetical protein [Vibrio owensii]